MSKEEHQKIISKWKEMNISEMRYAQRIREVKGRDLQQRREERKRTRDRRRLQAVSTAVFDSWKRGVMTLIKSHLTFTLPVTLFLIHVPFLFSAFTFSAVFMLRAIFHHTKISIENRLMERFQFSSSLEYLVFLLGLKAVALIASLSSSPGNLESTETH